MKKILLLFLIALFAKCTPDKRRYKEGDTVYLKPDSTKGIVIAVYMYGENCYRVNNPNWNFSHEFSEVEVY